LSENGNEVRVEQVLHRLKEEVRQERAKAAPPASEAGPVDLGQLIATQRVNPHLPIAWPKWPPGLAPKLAALAKKVTRRLLRWYVNPIVEQQNEFNAAVCDALERQLVELQALKTQAVGLRQDLQKRVSADALRQREAEDVSMRLGRLERWSRESAPGAELAVLPPHDIAHGGPSAGAQVTGLDYFRLESRYRPSGLLRERQREYLGDFVGCHQVLDIGCGRGEFVQLLVEQGIEARGIDLDVDAVAYAQELGLPVQQADALIYLAELPESSLDGVFMAQVVEHLTPSYLISMLRTCQRKMRPGAVLVAETINPVCLWALANWYLIDPTHVRPVHPDTLSFILESVGFWQIEIRYLSPVLSRQKLVELEDRENLPADLRSLVRSINENVKHLNDFLYGFQEYAVVARRVPNDDGTEAQAGAQQETA
jgi:2-polyprenyl-3-methyl-5-hydroxy-6-metoxy-1,4-benzoquinol methylase